MTHQGRLRLAVAGVGNNISALLQGVYYYRQLIEEQGEDELPGITTLRVGAFMPTDIEFVAAYEVDPNKVGKDLTEGVLAAPNNYPRLEVPLPMQGVRIEPGLPHPGSGCHDQVVTSLTGSGADVLLYSLPSGLQWAATEYAQAALAAGVAFVNCTPDEVARDGAMLKAFEDSGLPLGDDLRSHLGASVVHRALLALLVERGITLDTSYQVNFGGNEDFRNLRERGQSKRESKLRALAQPGVSSSQVEVIPSAGYVRHLADQKVAHINIEGRGWAGTGVSVDVKLKVQDSSNASGVIIDLIRIAAACQRLGWGGFPAPAVRGLKSPPDGCESLTPAEVDAAARELDEAAEALGLPGHEDGPRLPPSGGQPTARG
jgi:myo-inositol-1-phosphate synthase